MPRPMTHRIGKQFLRNEMDVENYPVIQTVALGVVINEGSDIGQRFEISAEFLFHS